MQSLETSLKQIDHDVLVRKEDREPYVKVYDGVRNHILDIMSKENESFRQLFKGTSLFGSYLENMKIDKPDEFDVHFILQFPCNNLLQVNPDSSRPGFVNLNLHKVITNMPKGTHLYNTLYKLTDNNYVLCRNELQNWLEQILNSALQRHGTQFNYSDGFRTTSYRLSYSKCATAHTVKASGPGRLISIDFVPAFKFTSDETRVIKRRFPSDVPDKFWFAVPKPMMGSYEERNLTFSVCAPQVEKHILNRKMNLKSSLRLLKALRDKMGDRAKKLKSYFIKTLYLHENDKRSDQFWEKPVGELLIHMIDVLLSYLAQGNIPFYWSPDYNLIGTLKQSEVNELITSFRDVKSKLEGWSRSYMSYGTVKIWFD